MESARKIAVVGSRRCSEYGIAVTKDVVGRLVAKGFVIVSGMAVGIDTVAHETAISSDGKTIGVLGYGFDFLRQNKETFGLAKKIIKSGGKVYSPFKKFQKPTRDTFVYRNKKMAEICEAVIVIEATLEGGSVHIAKLFEEAGKPIYAIPGSIFSHFSKGTNQLIKDGALMLNSATDIL